MSKYLIFCISLHKNEKFPPCVICLVCMQSTGPKEYKVWSNDFMYMINSFHKCLSFFYYKAFLSATHAWGGWISKVSNTFQKINCICTIQVEFSHICVYRTSVWHQYFFSVFALICCCFFAHHVNASQQLPGCPGINVFCENLSQESFSSVTMHECSVCSRKFSTHSRKVTCQSCKLASHLNCITLSQDHKNYIDDDRDTWYCFSCNSCIFPFNDIDEDFQFMAAVKEMSSTCENALCSMSDKLFLPFELNDKDHSIFSDTDPDLHYYNSLN